LHSIITNNPARKFKFALLGLLSLSLSLSLRDSFIHSLSLKKVQGFRRRFSRDIPYIPLMPHAHTCARVQIVRAYFRGGLAGWSTITEYEA